MNSGKILLVGLILLTLGRFWLASQLEITPGEAILWQKSNRPDFTYTAPETASCSMARLGGQIFGQSTIALRYLNPLLALSSSLLLLFVVRRTLTPAVANWSIVLLNLTPAFNRFALHRFADGAVFLFATLALFCFWWALHRKRGHLLLWAATGGIITLAIAFHPTLTALPGAFVVFLILNRHRRGQWLRPGVYLMIAITLVGYIAARSLQGDPDPVELSLVQPIPPSFTEALFSLQPLLFLVTPMILFGLFWIPAAFIRQRSLLSGGKLFTLLPGLAFLLIGCVQWKQDPSQPILIGMLLLIPSLTATWFETDIAVKRYRPIRILTLGTTAIIGFASLNASILRDFRIPWPAALSLAPAGQYEETATLLAEAASHTYDTTRQPIFLISPDPGISSAISFYLETGSWHHHPLADSPKVHLTESPSFDHDYQRWPGYARADANFQGKTALLIQPYDESVDKPPANIINAFESWSPAGVLGIQRRRQTVRSWILFQCSNYRGLPF